MEAIRLSQKAAEKSRLSHVPAEPSVSLGLPVAVLRAEAVAAAKHEEDRFVAMNRVRPQRVSSSPRALDRRRVAQSSLFESLCV